MIYWEINGSLDNSQTGLVNYQQFEQGIYQVGQLFGDVFGEDRLNSIELFIDNATAHSGDTPVILPIFGKYVIIKLGIKPHHTESEVAFQFAHELTHFVFYTYLGIDKPFANPQEETICSASALITIKQLYPSDFISYDNHTRGFSKKAYREGADYAESIKYDFNKLKCIIEEFKY